MTAEHLYDRTIEAYLDSELSPEAKRTVESHLVACPRCRGRTEDLRIVSHTVAETIPAACAFCPSAPFWRRLSARLASSSESLTTYDLLAFLPAILFGTLGLSLAAAIRLVQAVTLLAWLGLIPPLGPSLRQMAASQTANREAPLALGWALNACLTAIERLDAMIATWPNGIRAALQIGAIHALLTIGLSIIMTLFGTWAWCLPDAFAPKGGVEP